MNFKKHIKIMAIWIGLFAALAAGFSYLQGGFGRNQEVWTLSRLIEEVDKGGVKSVAISPGALHVTTKESKKFLVHNPWFNEALSERLLAKKVSFWYQPPETSLSILVWLLQVVLPVLLFVGVWFFFFRQSQASGGRAVGFGRSKAKLSDPKRQRVTFDDVEGVEGAKDDLREVVEFLRHPEKFEAVGGVIPKGVLLSGPPGTGKTLLARAVSGEAGVPFFSISGADFMEMFVGVGASRVRDLFAQAKEHAPCIVFIDEIDAVGRQRGVGMGGGHDEREQTLNQLLVEMDGFDPKEEVIVIAATNRSDVLDAALLRPGRFDRRIQVDLPNLEGRKRILKVHMAKVRLAEDVDPFVVAKGTPGFSGADLANLVNESALRAARLNKKSVQAEDLEISRDKILMGAERASLVMTPQERRMTAYHEAGHAVVAYHCPHSDPIHKATIMPRGSALGMVVRLPETDRVSLGRQRLLDDLAVAMAGRLAEEIIFGADQVTTGASSDFRMATELARRMVCEWGMSEAVGLINWRLPGADSWSGPLQDHSQKALEVIEAEVRALIDGACIRVKQLLARHHDHLELVACALLERETLSGQEIDLLLTTGSLPALITAQTDVSSQQPEQKEGADSDGRLGEAMGSMDLKAQDASFQADAQAGEQANTLLDGQAGEQADAHADGQAGEQASQRAQAVKGEEKGIDGKEADGEEADGEEADGEISAPVPTAHTRSSGMPNPDGDGFGKVNGPFGADQARSGQPLAQGEASQIDGGQSHEGQTNADQTNAGKSLDGLTQGTPTRTDKHG
jgi:cell division protease FtsH